MLHVMTLNPANAARSNWGGDVVNAPCERVLAAHEPLAHEGDDSNYIYEIIEGVVSSCKIFSDGRRQIVAFAYPGELVGLGHQGTYRYDFEAVSVAKVRAIPKTQLLNAIRERPEMAEKLLDMATSEVAQVQEHSINLGRKTALERVASFLVDLAERKGGADDDVAVFELPMSRAEIADFLGLTIETVSRNLTKLRARHVIEVTQMTNLTIPDMDRLRDFAECEDEAL